MSTHLRPRTTETDTTRTTTLPYATRGVPYTFSPHNTNPCPEMFSEKWTATDR